MIEVLRRQFRRIRRLFRFAVVILRARAAFRRLERSSRVMPYTRVRLLQQWCRDSLAALDVQVEVEDEPPRAGLFVSNHLSYLDILVCSSALPCAFVSKAEVARWPFIGRLAEYGGTIFVQREMRSASLQANQQIAEYLKSGIAVALFPEGTTTDGSRVLRFHSSMLQPAIDAGVPVTSCAIRYEVSDGTERDVAWWGDMTLLPHVWKLLGKPTITATIAFGEPLKPSLNRKVLSDAARQRVIELRSRLIDCRSLEEQL
jgi:1-acyl-sn-glycerol-3-phosphate acyltransferase